MRTPALFVLVAVVILAAAPAAAQTPEDEVRSTIDTFFDGMRAGDSTMVRSTLLPGAIAQRARDDGFPTMDFEGFLTAVGTPHDEVWDERIGDVKILVDGRLASAWMEFAFYLGENLSHCGVNSMQLYRTDDGWKIAYLADTNRGLECHFSSDGN